MSTGNRCTRCGSYAINHHSHGRDGSEPGLCDVCYWRARSERAQVLARELLTMPQRKATDGHNAAVRELLAILD